MCSLCGIVDFENPRGADISELCAMRGGGSGRIYVTDSAALCSSGAASARDADSSQPVTVVFGQRIYTAVYCGRLENAYALRSEFCALGAVFSSDSDAETVIFSYIFFGKRCPSRLRGGFSFCIYDECRERLFAARSKTGDINLFYTFRGSSMVFSSTESAFADGAYSLGRGMCGFFTSGGFNTEKY